MTISKQMNARLEKIDNLIERGYKLENLKILGSFEIPLPTLTNSEGKNVNILFGGPAGFSWIALFFYPFLYFQESFFLFILPD